MKRITHLICPVSPERIDENRVRITALSVILVMGAYFVNGSPLFPAFLVADFYVRAFTRLTYSPLSFVAHLFLKATSMRPVYIDKAPKVFAARIGLLFTTCVTLAATLEAPFLAYFSGSVLVLFAFLECGLNFCMGCWLYTYVVFPLVGKGR